MKFLQNKILIGAGCILLAGIFAFAVLPGMYQGKGGTERVIKVSGTVSAGTKIEEAMLTEVEVGSFGLPETVVKEKKDIVGKYARTEITPEDCIVKSKLSDYAANEKLDGILASGQKLVTVTLPSIAAGVGNHLQAGDVISLICYKDDVPMVYEELKNIEVYSIENDAAQDIAEVNAAEEKSDTVAATLTLIVNDTQAKRLVEAEYSGKLHAVFERKGQLQ
ncbi:Flp pilus assembly protein CpaB [Ructibacterium gallinarum]|uniref:Pilus assembly protein CpaB n=1 Tax=Ructibacterium gallinarum TaxID=2779355 RepID=A0A9D5LYX9_9FIRM|nr:RcpC/CpaB family pilus assembly protein [Ructibacterium gallinarum]MBE5039487.1 pilus assembly protein CpaB [Ructibacterium gallinarum]